MKPTTLPLHLSCLSLACALLAASACTDEVCEGDECLVVGPEGPAGPEGPPGPALYVNPETGIEYALNASPCGFTTPYSGNVGGYTSANGLCQDIDSCNPAAHVCTTDELIRYVSTGGTLPVDGRFVSYDRDNCGTFTYSGTATDSGLVWDVDDNRVRRNFSCDTLFPLLCCD